MIERPILFNGEMVRAILDRTKTQTRRPVVFPDWFEEEYGARFGGGEIFSEIVCPYGTDNDRLYVRETWAAMDFVCDGFEREDPQVIGYRADKTARHFDADSSFACDSKHWNWNHDSVRWRPSIHMPKWAARLWLDVVGVRVERLQDITLEDCLAEGMRVNACQAKPTLAAMDVAAAACRALYSSLWDAAYGKAVRPKDGRCSMIPIHSWEANPWVWVIEFRRD